MAALDIDRRAIQFVNKAAPVWQLYYKAERKRGGKMPKVATANKLLEAYAT